MLLKNDYLPLKFNKQGIHQFYNTWKYVHISAIINTVTSMFSRKIEMRKDFIATFTLLIN